MSRSSGDHGFVDIIFSWSLEDIFNEDLYKDKVEPIDLSFKSVRHYFGSYVYPLLEETRAQLCSSMEILSSAPYAEVISLEETYSNGKTLYNVKTDSWKNRFSGHGKELYKTLFGDLFILADFKPETVEDLQRVGRTWTLVLSAGVAEEENENDNTDIMSTFKVAASKNIDVNEEGQKSLFIVFLTNIIPDRRIWSALHMPGNSMLIKKILCAGGVVEESCEYFSLQPDYVKDDRTYQRLSSELNGSQYEAIWACLSSIQCCHKSTVDLIWGPPGTGKTKTLGTLLYALLKMNHRTLVCAPTNVAVKEVASRVLSMVRESFDRNSEALFCALGDMVLFGNHERLKVGADIEDIYLDYRVKQLMMCFAPLTGWRCCFSSMIDLLENCVSHYHIFIENELRKDQEQVSDNNINKTKDNSTSHCSETEKVHKTFLEFVRERFLSVAVQLRDCISVLCTHVARSYILDHNFEDLVCLIHKVSSFEALLFQSNIVSEVLEKLFSPPEHLHNSCESSVGVEYLLYKSRTDCLSSLRTLKGSLDELSLPNSMNKESIREFCLQTSSLIFSTASSSFKLHSVVMEPLKVLVIDEAAQLKECESIIPLLLPNVEHAVLVGDECQLPAMVASNVSHKVGFGRSLFARLSSLGHPNHFLNIQYRMHPAISSFPNSHFYFNQILDAPNVVRKNYRKQYLPGPMFGPYSFINVVGGIEEFDDAGRSRKNMVEVAIVMKIIKNCFKAWCDSKENLSIGVVSPYAAQVVAIQDLLGQRYDTHDGFDVKVKTIDGFQGGERDIIILSTVRTNHSTSLQFISNHQRTNVALTRARYCLWVLGNERTLTNEENVWKSLVLDAKKRQCFFNADEDKELAKSIWDTKKELDQLDDLLNPDSFLFKKSRWKVLFSDNFLKSFKKLRSKQTKKLVLDLLLKLSTGWRPKRMKVDLLCGNSSQILKQFKVESLFVVCSTDIVKESTYTQVLKIWDIMPLEDVPKLVKRLDNIFGSYTDEFISCCSEKCLEGNMVVPISWERSTEITKFKTLDNNGNEAELSGCDQRIYVENSKVEESLLLMKFYSLSSVVISHLLSDRISDEFDLPFEVSDEEYDIILFPKSTFVLGRSGTGKTTVLTVKLFQKEYKHHMAVEETYGINSAAVPCLNHDKEYKKSSTTNDRPVLHQLFVTVSPKLCQAVKHHVVRLKRFVCGGNIAAESNSIEEDIVDVDTSIQFKNTPDSFMNLPIDSYPLVITFQKFLMMLDGTVGISYFERFSDLSSDGKNLSARSVALETFIRKKEVTYGRFDSLYWPHFNYQYTKKLDSSRVFTEIISHIKGGMQAVESSDGKLSREEYLSLSENRASSLIRQKREIIYDIYQSYEKMKNDKGDFDLADIVIDLHRRLRINKYEGDEMHFVYIDEVQDLTMNQIALFKYVCQNVEEGFVFCGDTAQTIARGIDFRFQDIKSLFYKRFVLESKGNTHNQGKVKGKISETFLLSQNFRTHAGVLKLSQSTIELLFRFFPHSIDVLKPETSLIYGEGPVVLECGSRKNAIVTIFGNSGHVAGKIVGFGAEQVILVRDDSARKEVLDYVEKQALVLTILECKGLEFQDVLLYNFFGSSPLKNRWRVIYEYMKEQEMLEPTELKSYPNFSDSKHNLLCSKLKQLYVAITRTRQRLWICENTEEYSRPMFDYWRKKGLVQFKELDDSLAQAMKVASSPEEWRSRGKKLYYQNNYEMATMCFERAGDSYWERKSKASGLRANANRLRDLNPEDSNAMLREAAEIFEGIGMAESAAQCFSDLGDYERAGKLYLEKCEEPDLKRAGDCFYLAGCYETAARVYAGGSFFSDCLNVCAKGGLFDIGLYYIQHWEKNENADHCMVDSHELFTIEQKFLENCARNYLDRKDTRSMMKFVKAFHSMDLKREFLRSLSLLDELLVLEEESGNFMEAANIAKMMGDVLHEVDLLGKASKFMEACELMLLYVLGNSLWSAGSKGWPIKPFAQKVELLNRALSFAKEELSSFYVIASTEAEILSNEHSNTFEILNHLKSSRTYGSIRGEIICLWKLLDAHFQLNSSKFVWLDNLLDDSVEGMLLENQFSVESLFHCWTCWKDNIVCVVESLPSLKSQDIHHHSSYGKFALNYLGVRKQTSNLNDIYILLIPEANWVMKLGDRFLKKNGRLVSVDVQDLVSAAESYWSSQLVSVGMKVLHILDALYKFSASKALSEFCQFRSLFLIYDVFKFLLKSKCFNLNHGNLKTLEKFSRTPIDRSLCYLVPLDWSKSLIKDMVYLRTTETCQDLVKDVIYENINRKDMLTYGQIGNVVVMILGTANLKSELFVKILARFKENPLWQEFIQSLHLNSAQKNSHVDEAVENFYKALQYTYSVNWTREIDYISPSCFMYLLDRLLLLTSHGKWKGFIFATKSSFVEWLIHQDENSFPNLSVMADVQSGGEHIHRFIFSVLRELLNDQNGTISWIRKSNLNVKNYFPLFLLRLIVSLCLLHLSSGKYLELLHNLLKKNHVLSQLPLEFRNVLQKGRNHLVLKVFAEAFKLIGNPLVVARFHNTSSEILCPDAVFVDLTICQRKFILEVLFPNRVDSVDEETAAVLEASDSTSKEFSSTNCSSFPNKSSPIVTAQTSDREIIGMSTNADSFWATMNNLWFAIDHKVLPNSTITKELLNIWIDGLSHGMHGSLSENPVNLDDKNEVEEVVNLLDEMKQLFSALAMSGDGAIENHAQIGELCQRILSRRPKVGHVMNKLYLLSMENSNVGNESSQAKTAAANDEHGQNALEESKDNLSKNSEGATNSGHGNIKENTKGKKNKKKKGKGGRRGKK
ncbi:TPR and ankyrin repeat-containing protein 1 [Glycine soja]|nr:TPR and ankyrin repeat-containing protein 1 [Glycine soja]